VQILALTDKTLREKLAEFRRSAEKRDRKGCSLAVNLASQINTIKNLDYLEFKKTGVFWLFFRGDVHF
jgi:hypothetical protein